MGRLHHLASRLSIVGALALLIGTSLVAGVIVQSLTGSAYADTAPYEVFCPSTPVGNLVLNGVTVTGTMSPPTPTAGQPFNLTNVQIEAVVPASVAQQAGAIGLTALTGTISSTVDATGATPASIPTGAVAFNVPIPDPIPAAGMTLDVPSPPATVGPFTATGTDVTLTMGAETDITFNDGAGIGLLNFKCASYANDSIPQSGFTNNTPPGLPISPVIATTGQPTPPGPPSVTGPYELYCPHTPVGDLVLNDVVTTASMSPQSPSAGEQFSVTGYQTHIPLPAGLVSAAAGLGNSRFNGLATSAVDAYGATTDQASTGSMAFDVPIPSPVPSSTLGVDFPSSPTTVGPFTALGGAITIAQDQSTMVVAALSSKAFTMSCTAYANDSVPTSGSTGTAPTGPPIRPVLAVGSASGTTPPTTTVPSPPTAPTGPYELYCPQTPVGNIVLNDTVTSATISPSSLTQGQQLQLSGLQTQFSIPQAVAQQAEGLGLTQISGDALVFLDTTGVSGLNNIVAPIPVAKVGGPISVPFPDGFGDEVDMPFDVTLPNPVPSTGVQFTATAGEPSLTLTALGGPITIDVGSVNLNVSEFGDNFGFFCSTFPNDSEPTGLAVTGPEVSPIEPAIATGNATIPPPPPIGPGGVGPYELYCPGTPVGNIVLNGVTTTATLSPPNPSPGQLFNVTNYQNHVPLPASIASAAQALGNPSIGGTATAAIDAAGASPSSLTTGPLSFNTPLPSPVPSSGVTLTVPTTPGTIGMFTATSSDITMAQNADITLTLDISGSDLDLSCTAYPDDSTPTGIVEVAPDVSPISPVIVTAGQPTTTPTVPPTAPPPTPPPGGPGPYELYCPGTPVGNIALNGVTTAATLSPPDPSPGQPFSATGFQTVVSLPSSIVAAAAALGNSAITGDAVVTVDADGATPAALSSGPITINAPIPSPVPPTGLALDLPSPPGTVGPFTATGDITLSIDPTISLTLTVSGSSLSLTCHPYANNSAPTGIVASAPTGQPVSPIIATSATTVTVPPPGTTPPVTAPIPVTTVPSPTTTPTTPVTATMPVAEITQAYETVFDPTASIAQKVAAIQDGASIEKSLSDALSSSLASSLNGAKVDVVSLPNDAQCATAELPSPCAAVEYDILGPNGTALLPDNNGSAVLVDGTWVVSTDTVCSLLDLFYQAEGMAGTPPGCPATPPPPLPTVTVGPPGSGPPTPVTSVGTGTGTGTGTGSGTGVGFASAPTQAPVDPDPAPAANGAPTTASPDPSPSAGSRHGAGSTSADPPDPPSGAAPIVEASSGSLAFTGLGDIAQWLAVVGGALIILGFVLLTMVDAPRRLVHRLARQGRAERAAEWLARRQ